MVEDNSANPRAHFYYLGANSFSSPINKQLYESDEYGAWVELDDNYSNKVNQNRQYSIKVIYM